LYEDDGETDVALRDLGGCGDLVEDDGAWDCCLVGNNGFTNVSPTLLRCEKGENWLANSSKVVATSVAVQVVLYASQTSCVHVLLSVLSLLTAVLSESVECPERMTRPSRVSRRVTRVSV
jgi:hypothetical protein